MNDFDESSVFMLDDDYENQNTHEFIDREQLTQISILLEWYIICVYNSHSKEELTNELRSIFKEITRILYLSRNDVKMVYRYYRYLYGRNEIEQFYTSDEIIFCTQILELMTNLLINKFR